MRCSSGKLCVAPLGTDPSASTANLSWGRFVVAGAARDVDGAAQRDRQLRDRPAALAHRYQQPAGSLDEQQVVALGEVPGGLEDVADRQGYRPGLLGGGERRQRVGVGGEGTGG